MIRAIRVLWPMWPCSSRRFNRPAFGIQKVAIGPKMLLRKVSRQHIGQPLFARNPEKSHAMATCKYLSDLHRNRIPNHKQMSQDEPIKSLYKKTAKTIILSHQLLTNLPGILGTVVLLLGGRILAKSREGATDFHHFQKHLAVGVALGTPVSHGLTN